MRRVVGLALLLALVAAALALSRGSERADHRRYEIVLDNAFGLVPGGDLKVGGVRAGETAAFRLSDDERPKAIVEAVVTEPGFDDFRRDASCEVKPQSLIGEYFLDCQPGTARAPLRANRVPVSQTSTGISLDLVNNILRRPYRERLRLLLSELGAGLAGRPGDIADVVRRAHPGLRETNRVLALLGHQTRSIKRFIGDADRVVLALEARKSDLSRFVGEAGDTAQIAASRRPDLQRTLSQLPPFLDELRPTLRRLSELADRQLPLLADLERGAPRLDALLARLGPFADVARPALTRLGRASTAGARAVRIGSAEVEELRRLAHDAPATAKPLRQLLESFDDRRRAFVADPLAKETAPPPPDPTAVPAGREAGFTGFEALANYPFWQALSLNHFDSVGHVLLVLGLVNDCARYQTGPIDDSNRDVFERCNQWLGPYQPGVNGTPDPTEQRSGPGSRDPLPGRTRPRRAGERRGPGEPEAGPLPGQRDISKPQPVLPPGLRKHLPRPVADPLTIANTGRGREGGHPAPTPLLEFLLGP